MLQCVTVSLILAEIQQKMYLINQTFFSKFERLVFFLGLASFNSVFHHTQLQKQT